MRRLAYRMQAGKKQYVMVDTLRGPSFDSVSAPIFSSDSKHFAYAAKKGKVNLLIVDHKQNLLLDSSNTIFSMQFSSDNKSLSYILSDKRYYYMVFHGVKGKPYDAINENSIAFTADGNKIAYSVTRNNNQANVYDGLEQPFYKEVGFPIISPDGKRLAYWAKEGNVTFLIDGTVKSMPYEMVQTILFSKDGKHLVCQATRTGKYIINYDGKESEMYQLVHTPTFSADGNHFVYAIELFSEDKAAFFNYAIADGIRMGPYETVVEGSFRYNSDGSVLVFEVEKHDEFFVVFNGNEKAHYSDVMQGTQIFSPDNKHFAYVAEKFDTRRIINADGVESKSYEDVYSVVYSPDSKKYVYTVKQNNHEFAIVDGNEGNYYDAILGGGLVFFDSDSTFHYIAIKDQKIYLVEEQF